MKNKLSTKAVAVLLAAVLLLSSGILSVLPGIDLGSLLEIKASAEDPKNKIYFDETRGVFFTVSGGAATIIGVQREYLIAGPDFDNGTYTLPNELVDFQNGKTYKVFAVGPFAFINVRNDIVKFIVRDEFRAICFYGGTFAGMDNLKEFEMDAHNAEVYGPLFEFVSTLSGPSAGDFRIRDSLDPNSELGLIFDKFIYPFDPFTITDETEVKAIITKVLQAQGVITGTYDGPVLKSKINPDDLANIEKGFQTTRFDSNGEIDAHGTLKYRFNSDGTITKLFKVTYRDDDARALILAALNSDTQHDPYSVYTGSTIPGVMDPQVEEAIKPYFASNGLTLEEDGSITAFVEGADMRAALANCFPQRDEFGELIINEDKDEASVVFYDPDHHPPVTRSSFIKNFNFVSNIKGNWIDINTIAKLEQTLRDWENENPYVHNEYAQGSVPKLLEYGAVISGEIDSNGLSSEENDVGLWVKSDTSLPKYFEEVDSGYVYFYISGVLTDARGNAVNVFSHIVDGNGAYNGLNYYVNPDDDNIDGIKVNRRTIVLYKSKPESIKLGPAVKNIPDYMFYDTNVRAEDIADAISNADTIGNFTFVDCNNINELDLSGVKEIGTGAFAACDGLSEVTIPESVESLGTGAFWVCDNLDTVTFNAPNCTIEEGALAPFEGHAVEKIVFGPQVNTIPTGVAQDINSLREAIFLADPITISPNAFVGSNSLENVETIGGFDSIKDSDLVDGEGKSKGNDPLMFVKNEGKIDKHTHLYRETVHAPSCIADGYTAEECTCGDITAKGKYNIVNKIPHTPDITPASAAGTEKPSYTEETCTEYGYYTHTCKVCGATWKSLEKDGFPEITNAQITKSEPTHKFDKKVGSGAADCENPAYDEYECVICGEKKRTATSPALGHDWIVKEVVEPTCLEQGYTVKHCERCGKNENTDYVAALGHDYGEYVYNDNATVFTDGTETAYCVRCGDKDVRPVGGTKLNDTLRDSRLCFGKETYIYFNQEVEIAAEVCENTSRKLSVLPDGYRLAIYEGSEIIAYGEKRADGSYAPSVSFSAGKINTERHFWARVIDADGQVYKNSRGTVFEKELVIKVRTGIFDRILATVEMALYKMLPERVSQFFNLIPPSIKIDPRAF